MDIGFTCWQQGESTFGQMGSEAGQFKEPFGIEISHEGKVCDRLSNDLIRLDTWKMKDLCTKTNALVIINDVKQSEG